MHIYLKCVIVYLKATRKKNYELVSKAKIRAAHFPTVFHSPTPPLKQGKSKTILGPKHTSHTHMLNNSLQ